MKQYIPEKMAAGSRYQKYFPTLDQSIQQEIYDWMRELITEEKEYCDQGNYSHMSQILSPLHCMRFCRNTGCRKKRHTGQYRRKCGSF